MNDAEARLRECVTTLPNGSIAFDYMTDVTRKLSAPDIHAVLTEIARVRERLESAERVVKDVITFANTTCRTLAEYDNLVNNAVCGAEEHQERFGDCASLPKQEENP